MTTISADNGIYIAEFPTLDGSREWRVIHAQAIDNLDYYPEGSPEEAREIIEYFGTDSARIFSNLDAALKAAFELEDEILNDDFCPILEYGVCRLPAFEYPMEVYRNRASACTESEQETV